MDNLLALVLLILFTLADWWLSAALAVFSHPHRARELVQKYRREPVNGRSPDTYRLILRDQGSLELTQILFRAGLVGIILWFTFFTPFVQNANYWIIWFIWLPGLAIALFLSEWIFKGYVETHFEDWSNRLAFLARITAAIMFPLVDLVLIWHKPAVENEEQTAANFEDELMDLVDAGQLEGAIEQGESRMIHSIVDLSDTLAREIMVPRIDILAVEITASVEEAADLFNLSGHSRLPVYQDSIDTIKGLLYAKDLLKVLRQEHYQQSIESLCRPVYFIPEAKKIDDLLAELQQKRVHMAIVVDEYGGVAGLVTLEDIVEEVIGEIRDEYDQGEEAPYQRIGEDEAVFLGRVDLGDFNEVMESQLPEESADTLGGFIYNRLGRVPLNGEKLVVDKLELTVEQVSARRIRKVRARHLDNSDEGNSGKRETDHDQ